MNTLIRNAFIVSVDPELGNIDGGDLLIENGIIKSIGASIDVVCEEVIDATGCIAIPGFVDTHRHVWEGVLRGASGDWSALDFGGNMRGLAATCFRAEDMYAAAFQGGLECLNAGVTTIADYCHNVITKAHALENVKGLRDSGMRAVWTYGFTNVPSERPEFADAQERAEFIKSFAAEHLSNSDDLVTLGICPEEPFYWADDRDAAAIAFDTARELGAPILLHANSVQGPPEEVELLDKWGLLGPDLTLVHMAFTTDAEWQKLGKAGTHVSFTPETELQMGMGTPPISQAMAAGVNISVGVDLTANNSADLFSALRLALQVGRAKIAKERAGNMIAGTGIDCHEALTWGTIGGARALGLEDRIGSLTPGKEADIVLIRADGISMIGWDRKNPSTSIIQQAGTHVVDTVLVRGKVVKRNGELLGDVSRACELHQQSSRYVYTKIAEGGGFDLSTEELYARMGFPIPNGEGNGE